jgi:hypothetical protein
MSTLAHSSHRKPASDSKSPEQALCAMFDLFEDALETMTPEKRKAWLDGLSEAVETPETQP